MKIKFKDGEENIPIIENADLSETSIFKNQYILANKIFKTLKKDANARKYNNIISFCGDRGTGKTSCMMSFRKQCMSSYEDCFFIKEIAPSFFDETHNIIELTVGNMYSVLTSEQEYNDNVRDDLVCQFNKVMIYMKYLAKPEDKEHYYDGLQELEALSVGLTLKESIETLVNRFLEYVGRDYLVITIDDLDLNIQGAYLMSEHIRKYLTNQKCIIMLSVKVEQLINAVQRNMQYIQQVDAKDSHEMAVKYVTKLIPVSSRVNMPLLEDYCDYELEYIYKDDDGNDKAEEYHSVKEAITHSIFWRTGYLFYNSHGRSSLIVPKSLRSLRQLIHLLYRMPLHDKDKPEEHKQNQKQFKQYFFNTWTQQLREEYRVMAHKLVEIESDIAFNKAVIANLMQLPQLQNSTRFRAIADTANYAYNISLGDVMRILEYISQDESDVQLQLLLFFVRSLYSIKMYENYDYITENISSNLHPKPTNAEQVGEIYSSDILFDTSNKMQKLVNGQYFSFEPDEVLPPQTIEGAKNQSRDYKLINGGVLIDEISKLRDNQNNVDEDFKKRFQLVEFFILSVSRAASIKTKTDTLELKRNTFEPSYLLPFNPSVKNLVFDVLSPFYNILNLEKTYNRFDSCFNQDGNNLSIYDFAKSQDWSLLNQLLRSNDRNYVDDTTHGFLSDAIIRNAEVLIALSERIKSVRFERFSGNNKECIRAFYKKIRNTGMSTYPKMKEEAPYQICFMFLDALDSVLLNCNSESFDAIYGRNQDAIDIYATLFSSAEYAQSTILNRIRTGLPMLYNKMSKAEWKNYFHDGERYSRDQIISIIRDIQER